MRLNQQFTTRTSGFRSRDLAVLHARLGVARRVRDDAWARICGPGNETSDLRQEKRRYDTASRHIDELRAHIQAAERDEGLS